MKKEEEDHTTYGNNSGESLWSFKRWLISFCGLEDIDVITLLKSLVWQYGILPPSPSLLETMLVVSICKYDLIYLHPKWHSYQNRTLHIRDCGPYLATKCVPRGWFSKRFPQGLFPYQEQVFNCRILPHVSIWADGRKVYLQCGSC